MTEHVSWRWCFYINLPLAAPILGFLFFIDIPDHRIKSQIQTTIPKILHSLDLLGFAIFASGAIMFLLALQWGGTEYKWSDATVIGLFCGSAAMLVIFLIWEKKRGDTAMIPLSLFKNRIVWTGCLTIFFFMANMLTTSYYMAIYFQAVRGIEPTLSGVYLLPSILSQIAFAITSGILGIYVPSCV